MGAWDQPKATCPYCGDTGCEADWCDVEVGYQQVGPYVCPNCGASEIGPHDENPLDADERRTGWFKPGNIGTTANTFLGQHVSHGLAKVLYERGVLDPKRDVIRLS
jgi:hypothetical protein